MMNLTTRKLTRNTVPLTVLFLVGLAATATLAACDTNTSAVKDPIPVVDSGGRINPPTTQDGGPGTSADGAANDCVQNPKTSEEIINGCTNAVKIAKTPVLPLLSPDGGLPPLP